jgi:magnesium chelatase family protein
MSLAIVYTRARLGIDAPLVTVEAHISNGLPGLAIVGLPETAVKESRDRVRSAIINSHFDFPARRITINLAPADLPKEGGRFDLAIALGILAASEQIDHQTLQGYEFIGELALSGELRPVNGCLPGSLQCKKAGRTMVVPAANADEAALVSDARVLAAKHLLEITAHLFQRSTLPEHRFTPAKSELQHPDLRDVQGQVQARRALEIAAAGGHNLLLLCYIKQPTCYSRKGFAISIFVHSIFYD